CLSLFFFDFAADCRYLHSFPTRRSSDLIGWVLEAKQHCAPRSKISTEPGTVLKRKIGSALANQGMPGTEIVALPHARDSLGKIRSEEHTSELQSRGHLVCRLLLEKKKTR